jgi:hypothetical protein
MNIVWTKRIATVLLLSMGVMSLPARAEVISTSTALNGTASERVLAERAEIRQFLARADVSKQLSGMGVSATEAQSRVAALTDDEVDKIHGKLQDQPAAGDIIGAVIFVFLVLLITDILGLTKVFPFTRSIRH